MSAEPRDRISSYLLGELDADGVAEFERLLAADPELRAEVEGLRRVVADLDQMPEDAWNPAEPPALAMPADAEPGPAARAAGRSRRLHLPTLTLRPLPAAGLAALLLALGVAAGSLAGSGGDGQADPTATLAMSRIDDGPPGAHGNIRLAADDGRATVAVAGLDPSGSGHFYELWLLDDDGRMVALGSFRIGDDGEAEVDLPLPVAPTRYRYFDLSLQEDNGDPVHSGVSVLRGPTSS